MAEESIPPVRHISYLRQAKDLAMGIHPLSKYVPPLLLIADAFLTSLIIYKVSCTLPFLSTSALSIRIHIRINISSRIRN